MLDHVQFTLIHGLNIPGSYAIFFFIASDFSFITRHMYKWVSFPLRPSHSILSRTASSCPPLFPSNKLDTFWPGGLIFQCHIFLHFHTVHGVFKAKEYWSNLLFSPPVDHILSEVLTMTHLFWVALHGMAHNSIELHKPLRLNKAVIHEAGKTVPVLCA